MSQKRQDIELMAFADGEASMEDLSGEERDIVDGVRALGEGVRTFCELETDRASAKLDSLWAKIETEIEKPKGRRQPVVTDTKLPWWQSMWTGVFAGGALAAAAILFVFLARPFERVVENSAAVPANTPASTPASTPATSSATMPVSLSHTPPEVENLEVYSGAGFILTIPGENNESDTAVIWVTPEESKQEDQI